MPVDHPAQRARRVREGGLARGDRADVAAFPRARATSARGRASCADRASPQQAFSRLDGSESEYARSTRWETLDARRGFWRGRVLLAHDPALEEGGLLALMRAAELRAVPALFGYRPLDVRAEGVVAHEASTLAQTYEVRWSVVRSARDRRGRDGAAARSLQLQSSAAHLAAAGVGSERSGRRSGSAARATACAARESRAQSTRVHVLERSLELKEDRERVAPASSRARWSRASTASASAWARARPASSTRRSECRTACRSRIKLLRAAAAHESVAADRLRRESRGAAPRVAPEHRRNPRPGASARRDVVHRDGAARGRVAGSPHQEPGKARAARGRAHRAADLRRARGRPRGGGRAPRFEAFEPHPRQRS